MLLFGTTKKLLWSLQNECCCKCLHFHEDQVNENKLVFREARKQFIQLPGREIIGQFCRQLQSCYTVSLGMCQGPNAKSWKGFVQLNIWPLSQPIKASGWSQVLLTLKKKKEELKGIMTNKYWFILLWPKTIQK